MSRQSWKHPHFLFGEIYFISLFVFFLITVWVFTNERKTFWKKKGCNVPFKLLKEMAKFIITVKNKSRISLVKLVTIISVIISSNKGNHFWSRSSRRVASFGIYLWNFIATFGGGGVVTFGKFTVGWDYLRKSLKTGTSRSALQVNRGSVTRAGHGVLTTCWSPGRGGGCRECYSPGGGGGTP